MPLCGGTISAKGRITLCKNILIMGAGNRYRANMTWSDWHIIPFEKTDKKRILFASIAEFLSESCSWKQKRERKCVLFFVLVTRSRWSNGTKATPLFHRKWRKIVNQVSIRFRETIQARLPLRAIYLNAGQRTDQEKQKRENYVLSFFVFGDP